MAVVAIFVAALIAATTFIAYTDRSYICENTGSRKGCREWFFRTKTNEWYKKSELEEFLETKYPQRLRHRWTSYAGDGYSLIPGMISRGHGRPGPILMIDRVTLNEYVMELTDDQKLELYEVFSSADEDVVEAAVEAIYGGL